LVAHGIGASPGAASGAVVFDSETAVDWAKNGRAVLLVRGETNPDEPGMIAAHGVLTSPGGKTSHAAVVARGMGKTSPKRPGGSAPRSIHFFHEVGLDYVSCSAFWVPIARLETGRAALESRAPQTTTR
jgi:phosphoenolpyruvate synthase/pyruvate phosphate dikinase